MIVDRANYARAGAAFRGRADIGVGIQAVIQETGNPTGKQSIKQAKKKREHVTEHLTQLHLKTYN